MSGAPPLQPHRDRIRAATDLLGDRPNPPVISPRDLPDVWREEAEHLRELGADPQAGTLEWCARALEVAWDTWKNEELPLGPAAEESGYTADHLGRLLRDRKIHNAGAPDGPRIRRQDLPRKPRADVHCHDVPLFSKEQIARSIVNSEDGEHDD